MTLSEERLQEIEERCAKATPGPWVGYWGGDLYYMHTFGVKREGADTQQDPFVCVTCGNAPSVPEYQSDDDIDFIAYAREDIPALVAEVRALHEALGEAVRLTASSRIGHYGFYDAYQPEIPVKLVEKWWALIRPPAPDQEATR